MVWFYVHHTVLAGAGGNCYGPLSLSTLVFGIHERQNDIVQHMHPSRLYLESRLAFLDDVVRPVKLGDHSLLLVSRDQLDTAIGSNISTEAEAPGGVNRSVPLDSSSPSHPLPICTECHPAR